MKIAIYWQAPHVRRFLYWKLRTGPDVPPVQVCGAGTHLEHTPSQQDEGAEQKIGMRR